MKALKYLNKYLIKYKWRLLMGTIFITLSNAFGIVPAQYIRKALDLILEKGMEGEVAKSVLLYSGIILLMALLRGVFLFFTRQTIIVMSRFIERDLKNEVYHHYQTLPLSFYRKNKTGDLMARISEDVSMVRMYLGPGIMYGLNILVLFTLAISYMFTINATLTLYVLLPLPILSVSIYFVSSMMNKQSTRIQRSLSDMSSFVQEAFSGIRVLKSFVREEDSVNKFSYESNEYKKKSLKLTIINAMFLPLIMFLIGLSTVLTIYVGGLEVAKGNITVGNIAEFILYVNLLTWPVTSLGWITSIVQRAAASQTRINEFLNTKSEIVSGNKEAENLKGEIEFKDVTITYPDTGIEAVKKMSFKVDAGKSLGIIGTTGSGKSTIANALCRLFDANSGEILIDGANIKDYKVKDFRGTIGYVPQDVFLFSDSVRNNIAFGNTEHLVNGAVEQAAKDADVYTNIVDFPDGFDTAVGERGITLSGGQKQRISIARAIIRNPKILIFDDCLSAVDTQTENAILNNLSKVMKGKTSVVISHRVSSMKLADYIIMMDEGEIIEEGSHEALMTKKGAYFELYEKQQ